MSAPLVALGYCRVSTPGQVERFSLSDQERRIRDYCQLRGYRLLEVLQDAGESGRLEDNPGMQRARELAAVGAYQVFVPVKIDRLGRENYLILSAARELRLLGIVTDSVEDGPNDTKTGRLLHGIKGSFAEYEWDEIRERMTRGTWEKARSGKSPKCFRMLGYRVISRAEAQVLPGLSGRDGELVLIPEEAEIVRELFRRFADEGNLRAGCRWFNESGFRTVTGGEMLPQSLRYLLRNETYVGRHQFGKMISHMTGARTKSGKKQILERPRARALWETVPCPAVVEEAVFRRVQERLDQAEAARRGRPAAAITLSGLVFCAACVGKRGAAMRCACYRASHQRSRAAYELIYYHCGTMGRTDLPFCGTRVSSLILEPLVYQEALRSTRPGALGKLARQVFEKARRAAGDAGGRLTLLCGELAKVDTQERRMLEAFLAGVSAKLGEEKLTELRQRREQLEREIGEARALLSAGGNPDTVVATAERVAAHYHEALKRAKGDAARLNELYRDLLTVWLHPTAKPEVVLQDRIWERGEGN